MITEERREEIDYLIGACGPKVAIDFVYFLGILDRESISIEEIRAFVQYLTKEEKSLKAKKQAEVEGVRVEWESIAPVCPECGKYLNPPKHICKKKGPENLKGWTCLWYCNNGDCVYEKYTHEDAAEEMKKLMEKGRKE